MCRFGCMCDLCKYSMQEYEDSVVVCNYREDVVNLQCDDYCEFFEAYHQTNEQALEEYENDFEDEELKKEWLKRKSANS